MSLLKKIIKLKYILERYSYFYYTLGSPLVSDLEYDFLINFFKKIKKKNNISNNLVSNFKIGSFNLSTELFKIKHITPMLSLNNVFSMDKFISFYKKLKSKLKFYTNVKFSCELKFDGIAVSLLYKNGKLIHAVTRGNGFVGEDITENIYLVKYIPIYLQNFNVPSVLEIRGEILILRSDFIKLNQKLLKNNINIFTNPRNAVIGILKKKNNKSIFLKKLIFFCHSYGSIIGKINIFDHFNFMKKCKKWGFFIHKSIRLFNSINSIKNFYFYMQKNKNIMDFDVDGIVIKVNCMKQQKILGCSSIAPKWAIAFKFKSKEQQTKILNVKFKIGKTGVITPIAILKPVCISGVVIKKASLYNKNNIKKLDLYIGDTVIITRSGEVIPKILNVVKVLRNKNCFPVKFPKFCPSCNYKILKYDNSSLSYCVRGMLCISQFKKILLHFCSSYAFNIIGFGKSIIYKLIKYKLVCKTIDIFFLKIEHLISLPGINVKLANNIIQSLKISKNIYLSNFIYALCIKNIGIIQSKKLANYCVSVKGLLSLVKNKKLLMFLGTENTNNVIKYISNNFNRMYILKLLNIVNIIDNKIKKFKIKNNIFKNVYFIISGKLINIKRKKIITILEKLGGIFNNYISKKIKFLILGVNPGNKINFFIKKNIYIFNEIELLFFFRKYLIY